MERETVKDTGLEGRKSQELSAGDARGREVRETGPTEPSHEPLTIHVEGRDTDSLAAASARPFPPKRDYSSLSVKDLLDARDAYHVHLSHLTNVVATAIGKYRIRKGDWYEQHPPDVPIPPDYPRPTKARTLYNSVVRPWSWPCVLVFVLDWVDRGEFTKNPDQMVPGALFLPDGRVIPTCVVQVSEEKAPGHLAQRVSFPKGIIGGGYLLSSEVQRRVHLGSVGCLVTDGNSVFALTNRHVTGEKDREIYSVFDGRTVRVGISDRRQLGKKAFSAVYPGWSGTNVLSNLDVGLIRVDDVSQWTTQIVSLGTLETPVDLTTDSITLHLIGWPVRAFGGASGPLIGQIDALFYRYKSMGGTDYVADFVIGPRVQEEGKKKENEAPTRGDSTLPPETRTLPGDSGTLWCWEEPCPDGKNTRLRPVALQWGGHVFIEEGTKTTTSHSYALATCLSTVCRELDVDVLRDWNIGLPEYWGDVGHYTIAAQACMNVEGDSIKTLMEKNLDRVSFEEAHIRPSTFRGLSKAEFVPLADVPDKVWKMFGDGRRGRPEHPNHFADMDKKGPDGKSLLELCESDGDGRIVPDQVVPGVWQKYYDGVADKSRGCLPFRVWQLYDTMVAALKKDDGIPEFVCAAGVLAHYVGDACQPLHISYMFDGDPEDLDPDGETPRAKGVHSAYESKMLNRHVEDLINQLSQKLKEGGVKKPERITGGHAAAVAVVQLMRDTFHSISPKEIVRAYANDEDLWKAFGEATVTLMALGSLTLAMLWESAWLESGAKFQENDLGPVDQEKLSALYLDTAFAPSKTLDQLAEILDKA